MMKIFATILFTILISQNAFAISGKDSWQQIRRSSEVIIQQPTFAGVFGPQGLFNACATDDELKSIKPVQSCISYRPVYHDGVKDYECDQYAVKPISISRTYIQNVCVRHAPMNSESSGECLDYEMVTSVYSTSFSLAVIDASEDNYGSYLFSKTLGIQDCK